MKPASILVVDGNTARLASVVEALQNAGYGAVGTHTFETARGLLHAQSYDLIMTDLRLAAHNGLHLVCYSRILNPGATAIVLNANPDGSIEREVRRLGAHYVGRAVEPRQLVTIVTSLLEDVPREPMNLLPALSCS